MEALEAAREVAHRRAEHDPRVPRAAAREHAAEEAPVGHAAPRYVPRSEHEVGLGAGLDQPRQVSRVVREVGVHLEHEVGARRERALESREVGPPEPFLRRAVQDLDRLELRGQPVGDLAGAVRRAVVHDQDAVVGSRLRELRQRGAHDPLEVLGLVVGGEHEPGGGHGDGP